MNGLEQQVDSVQENPLPVIILCGGRSRRMGTDKFRLPLGSGTVLSLIEDSFSKIATHQIIVVGRDATPPPSRRTPIIVHDEGLDLGPMEGLRVGLSHCRKIGAAIAMVTTGDAPIVSIRFYQFMIDALLRDKALQGVVPFVDDTWHPLTAVYRTEIVDLVSRRIEREEFRVKDLVNVLNVLKLTRDTIEAYDPGLQSIRNVNTRDQYLQMRSEMESSSEPGLTG